MAEEELFAEVIRSASEEGKTGVFFVCTDQVSEDVLKFYLREGSLYHIQYGTAAGKDVLEILEYYTLKTYSFFEGVRVPEKKPTSPLPPTWGIIGLLRKLNKKVRPL